MNLEARDKKAISDVRMDKAREFLSDAEANYNEKRYRSSVNRSYYAALNAVRSILALEGVNPGTHEGAVTMLSLRFVKTDLLPIDLIKQFKLLLSRRTDVDYGDFDTVDNDDAGDALKNAENIINEIDQLRVKLIKEIDQ